MYESWDKSEENNNGIIEVILSKENLNRAYQKVVANKGAGGIDGITVEELGDYKGKTRT